MWRELLDRGGKGLYLGGLSEFEQYARHYYDVVMETDTLSEQKVAAENLDTLKALELERQTSPKVEPLRLCITNATSETAYHLASLIARGGIGGEQVLALQLLDSADNLPQLEGTAMELTDLAGPHLVSVQVTSSVQEALSSVSVAFILDYPHPASGQRQGEPAPSTEEHQESGQRQGGPAPSTEEQNMSEQTQGEPAPVNEEHQESEQTQGEPAPLTEEQNLSEQRQGEPAPSTEEHQESEQKQGEPAPSTEEHRESEQKQGEPAPSTEEHQVFGQRQEEPAPVNEEHRESEQTQGEPAPSTEEQNMSEQRQGEPTPSKEEHQESEQKRGELVPVSEEHQVSEEEPAPSTEKHQESEQRQGEPAQSTEEQNMSEQKQGEPAPSTEEQNMSKQRQGEPAPSTEKQNTELASSALRYHQYATTLDFCAQKDVKVILSGKYANTGAAIMAKAVTSIPKTSFVACPSLAEAQARSILAQKLNTNTADVRQVAMWGRTHGAVLSDTSHTLAHHFKGAVVGPESFSLPVRQCIFEKEWLSKEFPVLLAARHGGMEGYRSNRCPLSEAVGLVTLAQDWCNGGGCEEWRSMGVMCEGGEGVYGVPEGLVFSVPVRQCEDGEGRRVWRVERGLDIDKEIQVSPTHNIAVLF